MRISTGQITQQSIASILQRQAELAHTQQQVSTGKTLLSSADDPVAAVRILDLQREISLADQYLLNADKAENKLSVTDGILDSATNILQRVRELAIQALNDTNSVGARQGIAEEITQLNEALVGIANTQDANDEYLFSGYQSDQQAFDPVTFAYGGDSGQRQLRVGSGYLVETNEPGDTIFGNGAGSVFQLIQDFAADISVEPRGPTGNETFLTNIDTTLDEVLHARTRIGTRLNVIDQQRGINESSKFSQQILLSQIEDLDYAEAITLLNLQSVGLEAAQQSYVRVQGLSLFNFL
ncbi:MAG: flagellar hook-associated protein FlgL [Methylophagaceae bacterium]